MPRPRKPLARALVDGSDIIHPGRFRARNEPTGAPIGDPPHWMTPDQAEAWHTIAGEIRWLRYSHRALLEVASVLRARMTRGEDMGVQAMNLLRLCLGQMGATPRDAGKVAIPMEQDPDDALFNWRG